MDDFYLRNATSYKSLVANFDGTRPAVHFSRHQAPSTAPGPRDQAQITAEESLNTSDILVITRIRPILDEDIAAGFPSAVQPRLDGSQVVDIHDLYNHPRGKPTLKSYQYRTDEVFGIDTSTNAIYRKAVAPLVAFAQQGGVGTLFAYGQTGSGKTHTITQLQELVAASLMEDVSGSAVEITIFDLAGNLAFDLLDSRKRFLVLEDSSGNTQLSGVKDHPVSSKGELLDLFATAATYRRTAPTSKNDTSSRSHSVCRINLGSSGGILYLVDLAGSEAARDIAEHGAERMRETREINLSLSALKDCIRAKTERKTFVPVRRSMLTKVLKHVFEPTEKGKGCKTVVIACVNPCLADVSASRNTLRYAEMLRGGMSG